MVKELAVLLGGAVSVESHVGEGTRFTVSLPLGSAHVPVEHFDALRSHAAAGSATEAFVEEASAWLRTPTAWEAKSTEPRPRHGTIE